MGEQLITSIAAVFTGLIGLAIIATLVSNRAATSQVISSATGGFAQDIGAATNPFSGSGGGFGGIQNLTGGAGSLF